MEKIIGKIESINKGDHFCNTTILLENEQLINIKLELGEDQLLHIGKLYEFIVEAFYREDVQQFKAMKITPIEEVGLSDEKLNHYLQAFYQHAPLSMLELKKGIEKYLSKIENKVLQEVTLKVYEKFEKAFYLHPAATKFHHAYVGGLAHHTYQMLNLIDPFIKVYPYLNRDLLYAGTILHDISKIDEMTGVDGEYTKEGQLLGHIVMGALEIDKAASMLKVSDTEEMMLLKHMMIAHHGLLNFGSPKKPQIGEALLLWYIDTIDSKFTELGDALAHIDKGEFTNNLMVMDRMRFYKPKL